MEKFLDFGLKIGKQFVVILMFLLIIGLVASALSILISFIPEKTKIPVFSEVLAEQEALYNNKELDSKAQKEGKKYVLIIDEIVKENNLNNYGKNVFVEHMETISSDIRDEYSNGLKPFVKDYYSYMQGKNITEEMLYGVLSDYKQEYLLNHNLKQFKQTAKDIQKIISFSSFVSCLLLFLLCLLFPLLVRIEANTRKN